MKKKVFTLFLVMALLMTLLYGCGKKKSDGPVSVTLNEVAHSIFYAPMYVAIEEGYFTEEGIDLTLITGFGADKTMTALLSGEADIGFMGAESTVYTYLENTDDPVVNFAQLTQRAGNFLVSRQPADNFQWSDLVGKNVLGGRKGGMPEMVFEYILKQNGIDPSEIDINQSIDFGSTAAAFSGGQGDYTVECRRLPLPWTAFSISLRNSSLNTVRMRGWIKKSWLKNAKGKLKHTSFSQLPSSVNKLNPA